MTATKQPVFFMGNATRREQLRIMTSAITSGDKVTFKKYGETQLACDHIATIARNHSEVNDLLSESQFSIVDPTSIDIDKCEMYFHQVKGHSVGYQLYRAIVANDEVVANRILDQYELLLQSFAADYDDGLKEIFPQLDYSTWKSRPSMHAIADLTLSNIIDAENGWTLIDCEWKFPGTMPIDLLFARTMFYFCLNHDDAIRYISENVEVMELDCCVMPKIIFDRIDIDALSESFDFEEQLQNYVIGVQLDLKRPSEPRRATPKISDLTARNNAIADMQQQIAALSETLEDRERDIDAIKSSNTWKWGTRFSKVKKLIRK